MSAKHKRFYTAWLPLLLMAGACVAGGFLPDLVPAKAAPILAAVLLIWLLTAVCIAAAKKLTPQRAVWLLFAIGCVLRIGYVVYTAYFQRQHDVWLVTSGKGHMGYIQYIAEFLRLPDTNEIWQFYHPPLHHILAGGLYRLLDVAGLTPADIAEKLQFLTAFYSCAMMVVCDRLFSACGLSDRARVLANTITVFHPTMLLFAGSLNNDTLCLLLACVCLLFFVRWWNGNHTLDIVFCALFLGLSMMTKLSALVLAAPLGAAFLVRLWKRRLPLLTQIKQYALFGCISIPLGVWYPIRNRLCFGQRFLYVPMLSKNETQYIGDVAMSERLWNIPLAQLRSPYQDWENGYNIFLSLHKTALFGERDVGGGVFAHILLYVGMLLAFIGAAALLWQAAANGVRSLQDRSAHGGEIPLLLAVLWVGLLGSYISFCFTYPFICSQDFRYLAILLPLGALALGKLYEHGGRAMRIALGSLTAVFAVCATAIYGLPQVF